MPKNYEYIKIVKIDYSPKEYQNEWYNKELITHIYGVNSNGEFVHLQVRGCEPRFWTKQNPDELDIEPEMREHITRVVYNECVTYSNHPEPLYTVYMDYPFMTAHSAYRMKGLRGYFNWHGQADMPFKDAVRYFYGWKDIIRIPGGKRTVHVDDISPVGENAMKIETNDVMLDIEAFNDDGSFAEGKHPTGTIYCWSIKVLKTGEIFHGTILPINKDHVIECLRDGKFLYDNCTIDKKNYKKDEIEPIKDDIMLYQFTLGNTEEREKLLIEALQALLAGLGVNIIEGFNVEEFDISYIRERIRVCNRKISTWNKKHGGNRKYYTNVDFSKSQSFDLMDGFRYYRHKSSLVVEDKRIGLDWLGQKEIGYGKIKRPSMIELRDNDHDMMSIYNIWDVELPARIEQKMGVLDHYKGYCAKHGCSINHYRSMTFLAESAIIHEVKCKEIFSSRRFVERISMEKTGGGVHKASKGVHKKMIELDLSGQYPGAIMSGNLDIKTRVSEEECDGSFPFVQFPSGRRYRLDTLGTIPKMLFKLKDERNVIRANMKKYENDKDSREYQKYKKDQEICKHAMASWSGGFGTVDGKTDFVSRFADNGCYNDITEISRLLREWNQDKIENYKCFYDYDRKKVLNDFEAEVLIVPSAIIIQLKVRYGDTDSTKCTINSMDNLEEYMGREFTKEDLEIIGEHYAKMLNNSYKEFSEQYIGTNKHYFYVKMEDPIKAYFQWGKKKLYVELDFDDKRHDKGVGTVRSDKGKLMKEVMDFVLDRIIREQMEQLSDYLSNIEKSVLNGKHNIELGTPQRIKVVTNHWYANMMYSNEVFDDYNFKINDKPVFFYLKKLVGAALPKNNVMAFKYGDNPLDRGAVIDYEKHLQVIKNGLEKIFGGLDTDWDSIRDGFQKRCVEELF